MKIKKILIWILLVIMLLLTCTSPIAALDENTVKDMTVAMNSMQLSLFKRTSALKGMDNLEIAKSILRKIGYSENIIQSLPSEQLLQILNSNRIEFTEDYICIQSDGNIIYTTKEQYEQSTSQNVSIQSSGESTPTEKSWAKLTTYVYQSNSNRTEYLFSCSCDWLTTPIFRMNDHIAIGITEGALTSDSSLAVLAYTKTDYKTGHSTDCSEQKSGQNEITVANKTTTCSFNLPNNITSTDSTGKVVGTSYTKFSMALFINGTLTNSPYTVPFNVCSAYFHQKIVIMGQASISFGISNISFSISPKYAFNAIVNSLEWIH